MVVHIRIKDLGNINDIFCGTCDWCRDVVSISGDVANHGGGSGWCVGALGALATRDV